MAAAQAFDFRRPIKPSPATQAAYEAIRSQVKMLEEDRPLFDDINHLTQMTKEGKVLEAAESVVGKLA
jgi:histidine ammonia-lyase